MEPLLKSAYFKKYVNFSQFWCSNLPLSVWHDPHLFVMGTGWNNFAAMVNVLLLWRRNSLDAQKLRRTYYNLHVPAPTQNLALWLLLLLLQTDVSLSSRNHDGTLDWMWFTVNSRKISSSSFFFWWWCVLVILCQSVSEVSLLQCIRQVWCCVHWQLLDHWGCGCHLLVPEPEKCPQKRCVWDVCSQGHVQMFLTGVPLSISQNTGGFKPVSLATFPC